MKGGKTMLPMSILPFVLAGCFLLIWAVVIWLKYEEHLHTPRRDPEAPDRVVY